MTGPCSNDRRAACLAELKAAISRTWDGRVACVVDVEKGEVTDYMVGVSERPEYVQRIMKEPPHKERKGAR